MLTDEELGAALRTRLEDEVAPVHAAPDLAATVHRRHARRTLATRAGIVAPLVAAVALTGTVIATGGVGGRHAPPAASTPQVRTVAYISAHTTAALANVDNYVLRSTLTPTDGVTEVSWADLRTGRNRFDTFDAHNSPVNSIAESGPPTGTQTVVVVNFPQRVWWTYQFTPPKDMPKAALKVAPYQDPTQIRDAITNGTMRLVGEERLNGRDTLHLSVTNVPKGVPARIDLWVDAQNYLPYRLVGTKGTNGSTVDYDWLPRTAANLAHVSLTPPAGFTHHDQPLDPKSMSPGKG